jgi:hypothetical protein
METTRCQLIRVSKKRPAPHDRTGDPSTTSSVSHQTGDVVDGARGRSMRSAENAPPRRANLPAETIFSPASTGLGEHHRSGARSSGPKKTFAELLARPSDSGRSRADESTARSRSRPWRDDLELLYILQPENA